MKKLLATFGFAFAMMAFMSCETESDGCLTCVHMTDSVNNPTFEECADANGLFQNVSEGEFTSFQFASGYDCQ